jgi:lactate 2-monooxygenase
MRPMRDAVQSPPPVSFNAARQIAIYRAGPDRDPDRIPFDYASLREEARRRTDRLAFDFVDGGAGREDTLRANSRAFARYAIVPRMLAGVAQRDTGVEVLGERFKAPVMVAPIGVQGAMHPDAEPATARACAATGLPLVLSTVSSVPMEQVAPHAGDAPKWFQLYWSADADLTASLLQRAEACGFTAIVVTLDTQVLGWRPRDLNNGHLPFLRGLGLGNYISDPVFRASLPVAPEVDMQPAIDRYLQVFSDLRRTWADIAQLRRLTRLPLLLKGIQHPDDARRGIDAGAAGLIVSNHGGRQVDGAVAALDALPPVVEAAAKASPGLPVLFDSGIRCGADVYKALALGASCTLIGRPYMYGLAIAGQRGVEQVMLNFVSEFDLTMALAGRSTVSQITRDDLRPYDPQISGRLD